MINPEDIKAGLVLGHDDAGIMEKLNEVAAFLDRNPGLADCVVQITYSERYGIAQALRKLEQDRNKFAEECVKHNNIAFKYQQRAEAAEAKLETENKWRDLALQFDGHRMQAISLLKMIVNDAPAEQHSSVRNFLKCGPLSGEEVMNERLLAIANSRPAPAVSLAELVPDEDAFTRYVKSRGMSAMKREGRYVESATRFGLEFWDACRNAILHNIGEQSK